MPALPGGSSFRLLFSANLASTVGDAMNATTLLLWMYGAGHQQALWLSGIALSNYLPKVLVAPLYGVVAGRLPRTRFLVGTNLLSMVTALGLAGVVHAGSQAGALCLLAVLSGCDALFSSAQQAAVPACVPAAQLSRANACLSLGTQLSMIAGPAIAAALLASAGPQPAILADAASFGLSALLLVRLRLHPSGPGTPAPPEPQSPPRSAVQAILRSPALLIGCSAGLLLAVSAGVNNTVMVVFLDRGLGGSPTDIAWLSGTNGIAQLVAGGAVIAAVGRLPVTRSLAGSMAAMALSSALLASAPSVPIAVLAVILTSMANAPFTVAYTTLRQTSVADELTGRVFALTTGLASAAYLVGSLGGSTLTDATTPRLAIATSAGCLVLAAVIAIPLWRSPSRRLSVAGSA